MLRSYNSDEPQPPQNIYYFKSIFRGVKMWKRTCWVPRCAAADGHVDIPETGEKLHPLSFLFLPVCRWAWRRKWRRDESQTSRFGSSNMKHKCDVNDSFDSDECIQGIRCRGWKELLLLPIKHYDAPLQDSRPPAVRIIGRNCFAMRWIDKRKCSIFSKPSPPSPTASTRSSWAAWAREIVPR